MGFEKATTGRHPGQGLFASSPTARLELLRAVWPLAVGPELARRTRVLAVEGRTLRVQVPDGPWRRQIHRLQGDILSRLRREAGPGAPHRLGLSEGPVDLGPAPQAAPADPELVHSPEVVAAAESIADPEIRAAFVHTAALYLGRSSGTGFRRHSRRGEPATPDQEPT